MSKPVDVVAVLHLMREDASASRLLIQNQSAAECMRRNDADRAAIAAVAELIAACEARDAARIASLAATKARLEARRAGLPEPDSRAAWAAACDADERYFAALAACNPATGAEK